MIRSNWHLENPNGLKGSQHLPQGHQPNAGPHRLGRIPRRSCNPGRAQFSRSSPSKSLAALHSMRPASGRCNKVLLQQQGPLAAHEKAAMKKQSRGCSCAFTPVKIDKCYASCYSFWKGCHEASVSSLIMKKLEKIEVHLDFFPGNTEIPSISLAFGYTAHHHHPSLFSSRSAWSLGSFPVRKSASTTWFVSLLLTSCMQNKQEPRVLDQDLLSP